MGVGTDDEGVPGADPSPWATDQVVAGPAPDFVWDTAPESTPDETPPSDDGGRRNRVLLATGCVATLLLGAVVLWPGSDDPLDEPDAAETTLDRIPAVDTPAQDEDDDRDGGDADSDTERPDAESADEVLAATPTGAEGEVSTIDLPAPVAAIAEPTEIVMIADGDIVTLSLPSGTLRRTSAAGSGMGGGLVVAPDAAAWFTGGGDLSIVPRDGPPLIVEVSESNQGGNVTDWVTDQSGSTVFLVTTYSETSEQYTVTVDGVVERYEAEATGFDTFDLLGGLRSRAGTDIVNDAGGVYVIDGDDDVTRISDGRALASNERFVLLRECDEVLSCGYSMLELATGEQRPSPVTTDALRASYGFDLSPDGGATLSVGFDSQALRLVDLVAGEVISEQPLGSFWGNSNTRWAADSSGTFQTDATGPGITFIDRATGESASFGAELGRVDDLGVRTPDAELESTVNAVATRSLVFSDSPTSPTGMDLVVLGELGSMALLDLDEATASVWSVPSTPGSNAPDLFAMGTDVVVLPAGASDGFVSTFGRTTPLDPAVEIPGYPRFPGSEPGVVWSPLDGTDDGVSHRLASIRGGLDPTDPVGDVTLANSELIGEDGNGRLIARVGGDVFVVAPDATARLTDGDLMAIGPNHALVRTCDDSVRCSVDRIDRFGADGLDTEGPSPEIAEMLATARSVDDRSRAPRLSGTMSPDGSAAFVRSGAPGNDEPWSFADFESGAVLGVPSPQNGQPILWNDDSSVAVYLSGGSVHIVERGAGLVSTLDGLGEVRSITAVGAEFAN